MSDPYSILGVSREASAQEIRRAYRHKARLHHPDVGGDRRAFAQILDAYELLGGKVSRRDAAARTAPAAEQEFQPNPSRSQARPGASSDATVRRAHRHRSSRRHRRYSAWRIVPESYSAARFPRRSQFEPAPSLAVRVATAAIWIAVLVVACAVSWLILRRSSAGF